MLDVGRGEQGALSYGLIFICLWFQYSWWADKFMSSILGMKNMKKAYGNRDPKKISLPNFTDKAYIHQHPHTNDQPLKPTGMVSSFTIL